MTRELVFALPGEIDTPTGGYIYDRRIVEGLRALGWRVDVLNLGEGFPLPAEAVRREAGKRLAAAAPERTLVIDGLAFGILPDAAEVLKRSHRVVALVHHPLALETGLPNEQAAAFAESEKRALAQARHVIVTSVATANILWADYGVEENAISVVRPGTDRAQPAAPKAPHDVALLAVGSVVPRKGYLLLVDALARLADLPWTLAIAGDRSRDPAEAARLDEAIRRQGLGTRISVLGAVAQEELSALYREADLFVLPSHFEGYGMAFAEALANGLPVIGARAGATPDTVPDEAGILVPPGDVASLEAALRLLIGDAKARERLAAGARRAARDLPDWPETAKLFASVIEAKG